MGVSQATANKSLEAQVGKTTFTAAAVHVGLSSTLPTATGGNITEPSGGSYARVATTGASWTNAAAGALSNAVNLTFPKATADWLSAAVLGYAVLFDASTGGNMVAFAPITDAREAKNNDQLSIPAGELDITLS